MQFRSSRSAWDFHPLELRPAGRTSTRGVAASAAAATSNQPSTFRPSYASVAASAAAASLPPSSPSTPKPALIAPQAAAASVPAPAPLPAQQPSHHSHAPHNSSHAAHTSHIPHVNHKIHSTAHAPSHTINHAVHNSSHVSHSANRHIQSHTSHMATHRAPHTNHSTAHRSHAINHHSAAHAPHRPHTNHVSHQNAHRAHQPHAHAHRSHTSHIAPQAQPNYVSYGANQNGNPIYGTRPSSPVRRIGEHGFQQAAANRGADIVARWEQHRSFYENLNANGLRDSYNASHPDNPAPKQGGGSGDIGGVGNAVGIIEGLQNSLAHILENEHWFAVPTADGKTPFSQGELKQIIRELAYGIYAHDTVPFFSLHFNTDGTMYPVIHPAYENTLVGRVISLLDYFMKGFLNGGFFTEEHLNAWAVNGNTDQLNSHFQSMEEYCKKHVGEDTPYISLRQLFSFFNINQFGKLEKNAETLLGKQNFQISFRIIAKQERFEKLDELFVLHPDFDVFYTIEPTPEYRVYLNQEAIKNGGQNAEWQKLNEMCKGMAELIKYLMPKLPFCKEYFNMLSVINFMSCYFNTLKKMNKIPELETAQKVNALSCPPVFPSLPIQRLIDQKAELSLKGIIDKFPYNRREELQNYLESTSRSLQTNVGLMSADLQEAVNEAITSLKKEKKENTIENIKTKLSYSQQKEFESYKEKEKKFSSEEPIPTHLLKVLCEAFLKSLPKGAMPLPEAVTELFVKGYVQELVIDLKNARLHAEKNLSILHYNLKQKNSEWSELNQDVKDKKIENLKNELKNLYNQLQTQAKKLTPSYNQTLPPEAYFWRDDYKVAKELETLLSLIENEIKYSSLISYHGYMSDSDLTEVHNKIIKLLSEPAKKSFTKDSLKNIMQYYNNQYPPIADTLFAQIKKIQDEIDKLERKRSAPALDPLFTNDISRSVPFHQSVTSMLTQSEIHDLRQKQIAEIKGGCGLALSNMPLSLDTSIATSIYEETFSNMAIVKPEEWSAIQHDGEKYAVFKLKLKDYHAISSDDYEKHLGLSLLQAPSKQESNYKPIHLAAASGEVKTLLSLIEQNPRVVHETTNNGLTALYIAAQHGHVECLRLLIAHGANLNKKIHNGFFPLAIALFNGHENCAQALINCKEINKQAQIDLNATLPNDSTALHLACDMGMTKTVRILLQAGAKTDTKRKDGLYPIHIAAQKNDQQSCLFLIQFNPACLNIATAEGYTALHFASQNGHAEMISFLLSRKANCNLQTYTKKTPLMLAIENGQVVTALMLAPLTEIHLKNEAGESALLVAAQLNLFHLCDVLVKQEYDIYEKDQYGFTYLHYLARNNEHARFSGLFYSGLITKNPLSKQNLLMHDVAFMYGSELFIHTLAKFNSKDLQLIPSNLKFTHTLPHSTYNYIQLAAKNGMISIVKTYFEQVKNDPDCPISVEGEEFGKSLAYLAAENGHEEVLFYILDHGGSFENAFGEVHVLAGVIKNNNPEFINNFFDKYTKFIPNTILIPSTQERAGHLAAKTASYSTLKACIECGISFVDPDANNRRPFEAIIDGRDGDRLYFLINPKFEHNLDRQIVRYILQTKNSEMFLYLLEHREEYLTSYKNEKGENILIECQNLNCREFIPALAKIGITLLEPMESDSPIQAQRKQIIQNIMQGNLDDIQAELKFFDARTGTQGIHLLSTASNAETFKESIKKARLNKEDIHACDLDGDTALHWAIINGNYDVVKLLIDELGFNIETQNNLGENAFHLAIKHKKNDIQQKKDEKEDIKDKKGDIKNKNGNIIKYLLSKNAIKYINTPTKKMEYPLYIATKNEDLDLIKLFLAAGAFINAINTFEYETVMHVAAKLQNPEIGIYFITQGAIASIANRKGFTPLHIAAVRGSLPLVQMLCGQQYVVNKNAQSKMGITPLHLSIAHHQSQTTNALLKQEDIDTNKTSTNDIYDESVEQSQEHAETERILTPLMQAAISGDIDTAKKLIESNAEITKYKDTDLVALSAFSGNLALVKYMVSVFEQRGIKPNFEKAVLDASAHNYLNIVFYLHQTKAKAHEAMDNSFTALHTAAASGASRATGLLLGLGANPLEESYLTNQTALSLAIKSGHINNTKIMLSTMHDLDILDVNGESALHYASKNGQISLIVFLILNKAKVDNLNASKQTPLVIACQKRLTIVVRYLVYAGADIVRAKRDYISSQQAKIQEIIDAIYELREKYEGDSFIHTAIRARDIDMLRWTCAIYPIDLQNAQGQTPIHFAIENNHAWAISILMKHQPKLSIPDSQGKTVYDMCAQSKNKKLNKLVFTPTKPKETDKRKIAEMFQEIKAGKLRIIEAIRSGFPKDSCDENGNTLLHITAKIYDLKTMKILIEVYKLNIEALNKQNFNIFSIFLENHGVEKTQEAFALLKDFLPGKNLSDLLQLDEAMNTKNTKLIEQNLAFLDTIEISDILLSKIKICFENSLKNLEDGFTEIFLRSKIIHKIPFFSILLAFIEVKVLEKYPQRTLTDIERRVLNASYQLVSSHTNSDISRTHCLLDSPNTLNSAGETALHTALNLKDTELVKILSRYKPNLFIKDIKGQTAFDLLKKNENKQFAKILLCENNSKIQAPAKINEIFTEIKQGKLSILSALQQGLNLQEKDTHGNNLTFLAARLGDGDLCYFLIQQLELVMPGENSHGWNFLSYFLEFNESQKFINFFECIKPRLIKKNIEDHLQLELALDRNNYELVKKMLLLAESLEKTENLKKMIKSCLEMSISNMAFEKAKLFFDSPIVYALGAIKTQINDATSEREKFLFKLSLVYIEKDWEELFKSYLNSSLVNPYVSIKKDKFKTLSSCIAQKDETKRVRKMFTEWQEEQIKDICAEFEVTHLYLIAKDAGTLFKTIRTLSLSEYLPDKNTWISLLLHFFYYDFIKKAGSESEKNTRLKQFYLRFLDLKNVESDNLIYELILKSRFAKHINIFLKQPFPISTKEKIKELLSFS